MSYQPNTLKQSIVLGIFFLLLVTTYASFSSIITFIFQHNSTQYPFVGGLSLILNYVVYLLGLTYAASRKDYKKQFEIAAVTYALSYALYIVQVNELARLLISIVSAVISGYGASLLWVSQGGYMVKLFRKYSISDSDEGRYMGIQSGIIYAQVILGGCITTFALGLFGDQVYFLVLTGIGTVAFLFGKFLIDPLNDQFQAQEAIEVSSYCNQLLKVIKIYPIMKFIVPAMFLDGFMLGFTATNFSSLLPESLRSDFNVGLLHISNGGGAIIGGYLSGYLSSKIAVIKQGVILFTFIALTLLLTLLNTTSAFSGLPFALITTFLWGICLFFLQGWMFVACVRIFKGAIESFAVVKQIHTISFIIYQLYSLLSGQKVNVFWTVVALLVVDILCLLVSLYWDKVKVRAMELNEDPEAINDESPVQTSN